ncbi:hypothetical protein [Natronorubrum halophilum]|uniref:hypothetical protein n=1 Tax=Natronorubrum halophilum TaxID=1702106 RepID=UPI000EF6EE3B|nr:hypothetical protein [Natronorubrum halophilum]
MEDISQPSSSSYSAGDKVKIYLGSGDSDVQYHGMICEIVGVHKDDLDVETGRITDSYSYILRDVETNEELPIAFHHHDLMPVESPP